jgi:hypothetical protein
MAAFLGGLNRVWGVLYQRGPGVSQALQGHGDPVSLARVTLDHENLAIFPKQSKAPLCNHFRMSIYLNSLISYNLKKDELSGG